MANILKRFGDIMSANINALLDKAEDPSKMIEQYLRDLTEDLNEVKAQTAAVMAEETKCKRKVDECNDEIAKMTSYAEKALTAGNESDAKSFISKKQVLESQKVELEKAFNASQQSTAQLKNMYNKLQGDISELNTRKESIKAKMSVAKTQEKLNTITSNVTSSQDSLSAFDRMEDKANERLDKANAMAELNTDSATASLEDIASKYDSGNDNKSVDDELAAMKAKLGV